MSVLMDIHTAQALVESKNLNSDSSLHLIKQYYSRIFATYDISSQQFFNSFDYYIAHPEEMDALYLDMLTELSKREEELQRK